MKIPAKLIFSFIILGFSCSTWCQSIVDSSLIENHIKGISILNDSVFFITEKGVFFQTSKSKIQAPAFQTKKAYQLFKVGAKKYLLQNNSLSEVRNSEIVNLIYFKEIGSLYNANSFSLGENNLLYISSTDGYLYRVNLSDVQNSLIHTQIENQTIYDIFYDLIDSKLWIATNEGVYYTDGSIFKPHKFNNISDPVFSIAQSKSDLIFASTDKIFKLPIRGSGKMSTRYLCTEKNIRRIFFLNDELWYLCDDVIGIIQEDLNQKYSLVKVGQLQSSYATCYATDIPNNRVYVGTEGKGAFVFSGNDLKKRTNCFPCDSLQASGKISNEKDVKTYFLGETRRFILHWNMDDVPDRLQVFEGKGFAKKKLYDSKSTTKKGSSPVLTTMDPFITIVLISNKDKDTFWKYRVECFN